MCLYIYGLRVLPSILTFSSLRFTSGNVATYSRFRWLLVRAVIIPTMTVIKEANSQCQKCNNEKLVLTAEES
jgi:hypothetical protein